MEAVKFAKLRGRIIEKYGTLGRFSEAIGVCPATISMKLNGASKWTAEQIEKSVSLLAIKRNEIGAYFFEDCV